MRNLLAVTLFVCVAGTAHAGGIGFAKKYVGKHPLTGTTITFERKDEGISLNVDRTLGNVDGLSLRPISRDSFETVFRLQTGKEDEKGDLVARVVTTGDCQIVERFALIFPSGLSAVMTAVPEKESERR